MKKNNKHWLPAILAAAAMMAGNAWAGCGTMITANTTDHWTWVTIYNVGKTIQHDYGWVAPHKTRAWHGGGSISYACGSFYTVRYEMKAATGGTQPPNNTATIFDTTKDVNPQVEDWRGLLLDIVKSGVECVGAKVVSCAVKAGLEKGAEQFALGTDAVGNITCVRTGDNKSFWVQESRACIPPPAPPAAPTYTIKLVGQKILKGYNPSTYVFRVISEGKTTGDLASKGVWASNNPAIVSMEGKMGNFRAHKPGTATVTWSYKGKTYSGQVKVVEK